VLLVVQSVRSCVREVCPGGRATPPSLDKQG